MHWLQIKYYNQIRYFQKLAYSWIAYFKQNYLEACREHEYEMLRIEFNHNQSKPLTIHEPVDDDT